MNDLYEVWYDSGEREEFVGLATGNTTDIQTVFESSPSYQNGRIQLIKAKIVNVPDLYGLEAAAGAAKSNLSKTQSELANVIAEVLKKFKDG